MKKAAIILTAYLLTAAGCFAQEFQMPDEFTIETKEDYAKYDSVILLACQWLHKTPFAEKADKKKQVNYLFTKWLNGNPHLDLEIPSVVQHFESRNKGLLLLYQAVV